MQVQLKDISAMARILSAMLHQRGNSTIDIEDMDEYWAVSHPDSIDFSKEPALSVGSLEDDWSELVRMKDGRMPTPVDLDRLASVLRAISATIAPPKG
jgi:hypothetical protein